ncbi:hypothetical protein RU99_GL002292 [Enterococcus casseliflavus]|nr:hypothetical protein RU99_GL002292 [Enterococcus casseliflavus]
MKEFIVNQFEDSKLTAKEGKYLFCGFLYIKKMIAFSFFGCYD